MAYISNIAYGRNAYLLNKYRELLTLSTQAVSRHNKVIAEYIWIGGSGLDMRSKSRVLATDKVKDVSEIPIWSFDGSSTGQALGHDSEVLLKPIKFTKDPFRLSNNILVLLRFLSFLFCFPFFFLHPFFKHLAPNLYFSYTFFFLPILSKISQSKQNNFPTKY